jgi:hypothetical protein
MSLNDRYLALLREFVESMGADPGAIGLDTELSYEYDGMIAYVLPHPGQEIVVIDIEIMQIAEPAADPGNLERLLLLHQLNSLTRFSHGGSAFVSLDNMLVYSRQLMIERLSGQALAEAVADSIDQAVSLRSAWDQLRELVASTVRGNAGLNAAGSNLSAQYPGIGSFA